MVLVTLVEKLSDGYSDCVVISLELSLITASLLVSSNLVITVALFVVVNKVVEPVESGEVTSSLKPRTLVLIVACVVVESATSLLICVVKLM